MKKISKELLKTYYWAIVLFAIFSIFIIVNFSVYLWKENQNDIKVIEEFIEYQMDELENREDLDYLSKEWLLKKILDKKKIYKKIRTRFYEYDRNYFEFKIFIKNKKLKNQKTEFIIDKIGIRFKRWYDIEIPYY